MFSSTRGFSLIELAIVLVVIGLVAGGILVGRNLIDAASLRAQISQIEQFQRAANNFRLKFNALPGDIGQSAVAQFGFTSHITFRNPENGVLEAEADAEDPLPDVGQGLQENGEFWQDLASDAGGHLIAGDFSNINFLCTGGAFLLSNPASCFPTAVLSDKGFVFVLSTSSINYYGIGSMPSYLDNNAPSFTGAISASQAYAIDSKRDDGQPYSGNVTAPFFSNGSPVYSTATKINGGPRSCIDTGGVTGAPKVYSIAQNFAPTPACSLLFKFQ